MILKAIVSYLLNFMLCIHTIHGIKNSCKPPHFERTFQEESVKKTTRTSRHVTFNNEFQPPPFGTISRPLLLTTNIQDMAQQVPNISAWTCVCMCVCVCVWNMECCMQIHLGQVLYSPCSLFVLIQITVVLQLVLLVKHLTCQVDLPQTC